MNMSFINAYIVEHGTNAKIRRIGKDYFEINVGKHGVDISFVNDTHADYYIRSRLEKDRDTLVLHSWRMKKEWFDCLKIGLDNKQVPKGNYEGMNKLPIPSMSNGKSVPSAYREWALYFSPNWKDMLNQGIF